MLSPERDILYCERAAAVPGDAAKEFVALADGLAEKHGVRFRPNNLLRDMAAKRESFYGRFARAEKHAA